MNKVIERIAELRDQRGWSNYHLSKEAGIGAATIINWYQNNAVPKLEAIQSVCAAFGISLVEFFNYDNDCISLTDMQKELLSEYDLLTKDEKHSLLVLIKTVNVTKMKFLSKE